MANKKWFGPLLVALGAALWATDGPFRLPLVRKLDPLTIVLFEHLIGLLATTIWLTCSRLTAVFRLDRLDWLAAALVGFGGSATATILFTSSFQYINPSVVILLQKLQPILVVLIATLFLGERPPAGFYRWAVVAFFAAVALSFPDFDFSFLAGGFDPRSQGVVNAISAAALWAAATVCGKTLLIHHAPATVTFWRYVFGTLGVLLWIAWWMGPGAAGAQPPLLHFSEVFETSVFTALLYIGLVPGMLAMMAYYSGLSKTPASVATFLELVYPVCAVVLNTWLLHAPLSGVQIGAALILLFAVTRINWPTAGKRAIL